MLVDLSEPVRIVGAFAVAGVATILAVPIARRAAVATGFYDHPVGYKEHAHPTPYLGGAAVLAGFLVAAGLLGIGLSDFQTLILGAVALWAVGTLDDRVGLPITPRVAVQLGAGLILWLEGIRWVLFDSEAANLALSLFWTVGLINAFNLMDNLDGAAGTVGCVIALGAGALAQGEGNTALAVLAFALAGACAGFLPANLASPSKIFLGDGGSMPIGFLVAGMVMAVPDGSIGWVALFTLAPMAGLPILDTALVVVSRARRGAPVLQGGRDHITHRLLVVLGSPRRVAVALATAQGLFCCLAILLEQVRDPNVVLPFACVYVLGGVAVIALLEFSRWAPPVARGGAGSPVAERSG